MLEYVFNHVLIARHLAQALASPTYELCKGDGEDCQYVSYRAVDETKGEDCRYACSRQRENLNATVPACYRPESDQPCSPYDVYGRKGYDKTFEIHVDCVKACHFVDKGKLTHCLKSFCQSPLSLH
ncbi:unnamed protein product [Dibothriocephalus latus]|uniref:Uncharacterized protein n=1 Tax=Dibothriocephalus latus TaxID=60516 RepID=A0A3P6R419_DIBLA|nr:unnamed protein product [Dibothriocephalus latus]